MEQNICFALVLTFLAGLATAIGGFFAFFFKRENLNALALGLGFSAGVMIYVSFMELLPQAKEALEQIYSAKAAESFTILFFFIGTLLAWLIDYFLPSHHLENKSLNKETKLHHIGLFTAVALAIHNFPEGLTTFMATLINTTTGISIALAIALHNIPEGISVALPIYHATNNKKKAFFYATLSGLAEPIGAIIGYLLLRNFLKGPAFGISFALTAGIMIYISLDELLPTAHEYGEGHKVIWGILAGMLVMALGLLLF
ncbi:MAG: zinc transporter ZupT [Elusimicrobiaceae bacterium]|nr:zinc transporter ZupT [Elusimicrobiaceae bacterium]